MTGDLDHRDDERMQEDEEVFVIEGLLEEEEGPEGAGAEISTGPAAGAAADPPPVAFASEQDSGFEGDGEDTANHTDDVESVEFGEEEHMVGGLGSPRGPSGVFEVDLEADHEPYPSGETVFLRGVEDSGEDDRLADVPEVEDLPGLAAREQEAAKAHPAEGAPADEVEVHEEDLPDQLFPAGETLFLSAAGSEESNEDVEGGRAPAETDGLDPLLAGGPPAGPDAPSEEPEELAEEGAPTAPAADLFAALGGGADAGADQIDLPLDDAFEDPYPAGESGFFEATRPVGGFPAEPAGSESAVEQVAADDDWAPLGGETFEEDAGLRREDEADEASGAVDAEEPWAAPEEWERYDAEPVGAFAGEGPFEGRRSTWFSWRLAAGAAAAVVLGVGSTIAFVRPEWMGMKVQPVLVARTEIARPQVKLELPPPVVEFAGTESAVDPEPEPAPNPEAVAHVAPDPEGEPEPGPGPSMIRGEAPHVAIPLDPNETSGGARPGLSPTPGSPSAADPDLQVPADLGGLLAAGDDLLIGPYQGAPELPERSIPAVAKDVVAGSQAFAQLRNGNFFVGTIKTMDAVHVTMRLDQGEVTLPFSDVSVLTALSSEEYRNLQKARSGFVRLRNDNRIVGNVLDPENGKEIIVIGRKQRVTIPRSIIEEIGSRAPGGVRTGGDPDEDAWIRSLVERRLQQHNEVEKLQQRVPRELGRTR